MAQHIVHDNVRQWPGRRSSRATGRMRFRHRARLALLVLVALIGTGALAAALLDVRPEVLTFLRPAPNNGAISASGPIALCGNAKRITCVVDGDTLHYDGVKIRIADFDTPEVSSPQCAEEAALGARATRRFAELMNEAPFEIATSGSRDEDRYGRKLRIVIRNGHSLGEILIAEGLAHRWDGSRHSWCN